MPMFLSILQSNKMKLNLDYKCSRCEAHGIKLWRQYNSLNFQLLCARCADPQAILDEKGYSIGSCGFKSCQLTDKFGKTGSLVPAVPTRVEGEYWGYTSVPDESVDWWKALPNHIKKKENKVLLKLWDEEIYIDSEEYVRQLENDERWLPDVHIWNDGTLFDDLKNKFTLFEQLSFKHKARIALIYIKRWKKFGGIE